MSEYFIRIWWRCEIQTGFLVTIWFLETMDSLMELVGIWGVADAHSGWNLRACLPNATRRAMAAALAAFASSERPEYRRRRPKWPPSWSTTATEYKREKHTALVGSRPLRIVLFHPAPTTTTTVDFRVHNYDNFSLFFSLAASVLGRECKGALIHSQPWRNANERDFYGWPRTPSPNRDCFFIIVSFIEK